MNKRWKVEFKPSAFKELKKLDHQIQEKILKFLDKLLKSYFSPRDIGLHLEGKHKHLWRYRVGNYRLICEIQDHKLVVLILGIRHRKDVYEKH